MNEPRCPGCVDTSSQAQVRGFLSEMTSHLRAVAPYQLVALGTEGYFLNSYEEWNSGGAWGLGLGMGLLCPPLPTGGGAGRRLGAWVGLGHFGSQGLCWGWGWGAGSGAG